MCIHAICHKLYTDEISKYFFTQKLCELQRFPTKEHKLYIHIIIIHIQGYITLNKYIVGIASRGLPKVSLWATKCVTKRP